MPNLKKKKQKEMSRKKRYTWRELAPLKSKERKEMPLNCFLDPKNLKYPICYKHTKKPSCLGLHAASRRASLQKNHTIHKRAESLLKKHNCVKVSKKLSQRREQSLQRRSLLRR